MFFLEKLKKERQRAARIKQLEKSIAEIWEYETRGATTKEDRRTAYEIANAQTAYDQNELDSLRQEKLLKAAFRIGLTIPKEYYEDDKWPMKPTLTYEGMVWTKRELRKMRRANFKSWSDIFVPILALLVALASVLKKR
jgi:hypothetical protein